MNTTTLINRAGRRIARAVLCLLLLCAGIAGLVGCNNYEPESNKKQAEAYYRKKYGVTERVVDEHGLGNFQLFGYSYHGMEYIMADGTSVVYEDDEGVFRDNRQASQIQADACAFAKQRLEAIDGALTPVEVRAVGYGPSAETYTGEGECWHAYYEGDIEAFLTQERPLPELGYHQSGSDWNDGAFSYAMAYDVAKREGIEDSYLALGTYFDLDDVDLLVVDKGAYEAHAAAADLTLFDDTVAYTVSFVGDTPAELEALRFKPAFITIADGVKVSSAVAGITLKEGDVRLEPHGEKFYTWTLSGDAAAAETAGKELSYYLHNDSDKSLLEVNGFDQLSSVCAPGKHVRTYGLTDGATVFLGYEVDIQPRIEILEVMPGRVTARYHTFFKSGIRTIDLRVMGRVRDEEEGDYASTKTVEFPSRVEGETEDGWLCEVDIPSNALNPNTLNFQFTYNNAETISVQLEQEVDL